LVRKKYTKWPQTVPNGLILYRLVIIYTKRR
jgi:hypothetical protein